MNIPQLDDQENAVKFFKRVENFIVLTHEQFMKGRNLNGLVAIMVAFEGMKQGSTELWKRLEQLIAKDIKQKRQPIDKD